MYKLDVVTEFSEQYCWLFHTKIFAQRFYDKLCRDPGYIEVYLSKVFDNKTKILLSNKDTIVDTTEDINTHEFCIKQLCLPRKFVFSMVICILAVLGGILLANPVQHTSVEYAIANGTVKNLYIEAFPMTLGPGRTWDYKVEILINGKISTYEIDKGIYDSLVIKYPYLLRN